MTAGDRPPCAVVHPLSRESVIVMALGTVAAESSMVKVAKTTATFPSICPNWPAPIVTCVLVGKCCGAPASSPAIDTVALGLTADKVMASSITAALFVWPFPSLATWKLPYTVEASSMTELPWPAASAGDSSNLVVSPL